MKMVKIPVLLLVTSVCVVACLPFRNLDLDTESPPAQTPVETVGKVAADTHGIKRRFINPLFSIGTLNTEDIVRMRTKRSYDECEKLQLCKLHARSRHSFFAAYELYFVNKENAQLWDHQARSRAECERRFGGCYKK